LHYYQFNIGDYTSHTQHLDPIEDIAYRRMLDWYYLNEKPLPESVEEIARLIRMREHCKCIAIVLQEFFVLKNGEYHQPRIDSEIKSYRDLSKSRKKAANKRWANKHKGLSGDASALQVDSKSNAKQEPLTKNHKPITKEIVIPGGINQPAWSEWIAYRKSKKKTVSQAAAKKQFKLLLDYDLLTQQQIIDQSIQNDYQGLFAPKGNANDQTHQRPNQPRQSLSERTADQAKRIWAECEAEEAGKRIMDENDPALPAQVEFIGRGDA